MHAWMHGCMHELILNILNNLKKLSSFGNWRSWIDAFMHRCMDEWMHAWIYAWIHGFKHGFILNIVNHLYSLNIFGNGRSWIDACMLFADFSSPSKPSSWMSYAWKSYHLSMYECMDTQMHACMYGWMYPWIMD